MKDIAGLVIPLTAKTESASIAGASVAAGADSDSMACSGSGESGGGASMGTSAGTPPSLVKGILGADPLNSVYPPTIRRIRT